MDIYQQLHIPYNSEEYIILKAYLKQMSDKYYAAGRYDGYEEAIQYYIDNLDETQLKSEN